uniref:Hexapeptide repeat-containing transferase n=1 Tax=viral metagenome TaxID=1070528 RepID=A0A6C0BQ41_9ZZZZ
MSAPGVSDVEEVGVAAPVSIGGSPQILNYQDREYPVEMGEGNIIREFTAIHNGSRRPTTLGTRNYIMTHCIINHDCILGNHNILSSGCKLAGFVHIQDHANLGMNVAVHQGVVIGSYTMIGMNAAVTKHVPPFTLYHPILGIYKLNEVGLRRHNLPVEEIRRYYVYGTPPQHPTVQEYILRFEQACKVAHCNRKTYAVDLH